MSDSVPTALFAEAKAWIAQQEAYEAEYKRPAPLTAAQRKALEALRLPPPAAPNIGTANYVGMLLEHRQIRPEGGEVKFAEHGEPLAWTCQVTIAESLDHPSGHIAAFPAAGYGLESSSGKAPVFPTKKAAKQYAAKTAVDWLVAQGIMDSRFSSNIATSSPPSPPSPPPQAAVPKTQKVAERPHAEAGGGADADAATLKRPTEGSGQGVSPPPKRQQQGSQAAAAKETGDVESSTPATETVVRLCTELNLPAPKYRFFLSGAGANVFDSHAEFEDAGDNEVIALSQCAVVRGVSGKEAARQAVAAKLLKSLRAIEAERSAQLKLALEGR